MHKNIFQKIKDFYRPSVSPIKQIPAQYPQKWLQCPPLPHARTGRPAGRGARKPLAILHAKPKNVRGTSSHDGKTMEQKKYI